MPWQLPSIQVNMAMKFLVVKLQWGASLLFANPRIQLWRLREVMTVWQYPGSGIIVKKNKPDRGNMQADAVPKCTMSEPFLTRSPLSALWNMGSLQACSLGLMHFNKLVTPLALSNSTSFGKEVKLTYPQLLYWALVVACTLTVNCLTPRGYKPCGCTRWWWVSFNEQQV